ncbi:TetR family transcriptional regulator [Micromonospora pisi]|uniref:TetR family transcriptional regulator n=1 Tax=Micromonospora pisi TaxID=589240 RepID=A0A495JTW6_9ACTN|nr:TetR/AcrR family transcriptional regulator C-terminal domain-containing protein [Micromonospora pisi]RKR92271.1 TetR family transcriptional regulator [Micromonospora pisi]
MGRARPTDGGAVDPEALWLRPGGSRLGRPPTHTRTEITAAAIAVADAEGLSAVTIRRVATDIGAGAMSLYSYVPDKETLLELMIDQASGEYELPPPSGDWRVDLRQLARTQRTIMRRHPWLPSALAFRQTLGPHTLAAMEYALNALAGTDLDSQSKLEVVALLTGFVANYVAQEVAQERDGRQPQESVAAQVRYLHTVVRGGDYPRLAEVLSNSDGRAPSSFDRLLDQLIDGLVRQPPTMTVEPSRRE